MPNRLLDVTVRPDWAEIERGQAERAARAWRRIQVAVAAAVLAGLLLSELAPAWPALPAARAVLLVLVTWGPALWRLAAPGGPQVPVLRARAAAGLLPAMGLLVAATAATIAAAPASRPAVPLTLPLPVALLAPALAWGLLLLAGRRNRSAWRGLGFVGGEWVYYALAGAAAGAALGFHLLLAIRGLPGVSAAAPSLPRLAWLACYAAGLRAGGEELLLRGLGYPLLSREGRSLLAIMARLAALNMLLALLTLWGTATPALLLLLAAYAAPLSLASTLLRYRSGSLAPALACNAAFSLVAGAALPW